MTPRPSHANAPSIAPSGAANAATSASLHLAELWRYRWLVPAMAALVVLAATVWVVRQPRVYQASASLEYDPNPSKPLGATIEDSTSSYNYWDLQEFYETQNYILRSRTLAQKVARKLALNTDASFMGPARLDGEPFTVEDAASRLMAALEVDQVRDTRVVVVSIRDTDPARAQLLANTYVDTYIDKSLEDRLGTSVTALDWLNSQVTNLKQELDSSELALYKFREEHHSLSASLSERQKLIAGQLQNYSDALTDQRTKIVQTRARLEVVREQLAESPDLLSIRVGPLATDTSISDLRQRYREAEAELLRLTVTYGENHPEVRGVQANLDALRAQLTAHAAAITAGIESELRELERAEAGLQGALNQVNQQGLELSLQEIEYSRLDRERSSRAALYETVLERAAETNLMRALRVASARVLDRALKPVNPVSPRIRFVIMLSVVAGLAAGVAVALLLARLDNKVRTGADIEMRGVTVLGVLPGVDSDAAPAKRKARREREDASRDLVVHLQPKSSIAECCRTLRTNITFQSADHPLRTIAVTSAMPKEGKTTVSLSLAITLAQSGRRVLLVDTDLRRPRLHRTFGVSNGVGITSVLAGQTSLGDAMQRTEVEGLTLLPCGPLPPNPSELLHTNRFAQLVEDVRQAFDVVVFDSPPLGAVTDPAIIAPQVDGTLVVARARSTSRASLDAALRQLRAVNARIIGAVLNGANLRDSEYASYHGYYRGYYADEPQPGSHGAPG